MAIVVDKAHPNDAVDHSYALDQSYVRSDRENAGNPNGSVTPAFAGEIVLDTTNQVLWQALDTSNDSWILKSPGTQDVIA